MGNFVAIRRPGCILFEYDPERSLIRIKRGKDTHLVDLEEEAARAAEQPKPMTKREVVEVIKGIAST